jgi:cytidine deaminase
MAIEFITPDLIRVNGYFVEINDSRQPDYFDELAARYNAELAGLEPDRPIHDLEFDLRPTLAIAPDFDAEFVAYQQIPRFLDIAERAARERAVSYRFFNVGASACAISFELQRIGYFFGANLTPHKGAPKRCAEMEVLAKAKDRGFDKIIALAIFGPSKFDDVQKLVAPTLHPCAECRTKLDESDLITDDTLVVTTNETGVREFMTSRELIDLHRNHSY